MGQESAPGHAVDGVEEAVEAENHEVLLRQVVVQAHHEDGRHQPPARAERERRRLPEQRGAHLVPRRGRSARAPIQHMHVSAEAKGQTKGKIRGIAPATYMRAALGP
jgi:hypothetical protein